MLPVRDIETIFKGSSPDLRDIVLELRNIISTAAPTATETVLWRGLAYFEERLGGPIKGGFCQIAVRHDHVRLEFIRGSALPDPGRLLRGDRKYKRYVPLDSFDTVPWKLLADLITASTRVDPVTLKLR